MTEPSFTEKVHQASVALNLPGFPTETEENEQGLKHIAKHLGYSNFCDESAYAVVLFGFFKLSYKQERAKELAVFSARMVSNVDYSDTALLNTDQLVGGTPEEFLATGMMAGRLIGALKTPQPF